MFALLSLLFVQKPKITFLFIAQNRFPMDMVWDAFFQNILTISFFVGFIISSSFHLSIVFALSSANSLLDCNQIWAEPILLKHALLDSFNERFVFLSDSCIPLCNFSYTYDYIMSTSTSFVDRWPTKGVPEMKWIRGGTSEFSFWLCGRKSTPTIVFPIFQWHCKRRPLPEFCRHHPLPADVSKEHNYIPDEHYKEALDGEITRRTLTHKSWDLSSSKDHERRGWHPVTYKLARSYSHADSIYQDNIYYETEYRREWCPSKGEPSPCFLFARKFTRPAALRLLNMVSVFCQGKQKILVGVILRSSGFYYARAHLSLFARSFWSVRSSGLC
ncbi:hypothetical protein CsSME_00005009 [Camellia sinensis var. sinensis]